MTTSPKQPKLRTLFTMSAALICAGYLTVTLFTKPVIPVTKNKPPLVVTKNSKPILFSFIPIKIKADISINKTAMETYYTKEARLAFIAASKKGFIKTARNAELVTGSPASHHLTLAYFESTIGKNMQSDKTSATSLVHITNSAFIEMLARNGMKTAKKIQGLNHSAADRIKHVARYITRNVKNGKITYHEDKFKAAYPNSNHSLRKTALDLRKTNKNQIIALAFADFYLEESLPRFKKVIEKNGSPLTKKLTCNGGDKFLKRLIHNWGYTDALKLTCHGNVHNCVADIVGSKVAKRNGWKDQTIGKLLNSFAFSYDVLDREFAKLLVNPPQPIPTKTARLTLKKKPKRLIR